MIKKKKNHVKGATLMMVLLSISVLSAVVLIAVSVVQYKMESQLSNADEMEATALAHHGLSIAVNPDTLRDDESLIFEDASTQRGYHASIESEDGRININAVLKRGDKSFLRGLITSWEVDYDTASGIVDSLLDWYDSDDDEQLNGAEESYYQGLGMTGQPYNRPFGSVAEMLMVKDFDIIEEMKPDWRDYFTIYGNDKLDIHEVDSNVLAVASEMEESAAESYIMQIRGVDGVAGTSDDYSYQSLDEALDDLGVSREQAARERILLRFRLRGNTKRVVSVGSAGKVKKTITMVLQNRGKTLTILDQIEYIETNLIK